jgi:type III restriction enzyme
VAIKEGAYKTIEMTRDHFKQLYAGVPYTAFLYDSDRLGDVRNFAMSSEIQIMVVTVGAINKQDVNNLYKETEKTGGEAPIDLIKATRPILIVDEPQSVDGGLKGKGKEALDAMSPLCTLRYSATHVDKHNMVYRLDAVDAYERKLVKQIEIAGATLANANNTPFVRLVKTQNKSGTISATIELDIEGGQGHIARREVSVFDGDDLEQVAGRSIYADYRIGEIGTGKDNQYLQLRYPGGEVYLTPGDTHGDVFGGAIQRQMIRRTIQEHLDKELRLKPLDIKVLSLFFIDHVEKYRAYDEDGHPVKGEYAVIFEEEFASLIKQPKYATLFVDLTEDADPSLAHDGYFSIDKKGGWIDTSENNAAAKASAELAYNLIMKDKEKLLAFETPLRFIFSHSALKEGWDNPNVFQICSLRDMSSERERRQTIGRGLRIAVNQTGERVRGFEVNTLTVIATESYEEFADNLQKEIESETGIRFGVVEPHQFMVIPIENAEGASGQLGLDESHAIWEHLKLAGYINSSGLIQDSLRTALKDGTLDLPQIREPQRADIEALLKRLAGRINVKNADERRTIHLRRGLDGSRVTLDPLFKELWSRIQKKTTYRVEFDNELLIANCVQALLDSPRIPPAVIQWRTAGIAIGRAGLTAREKADGANTVTGFAKDTVIPVPDVVTELESRTHLTRRTITQILLASGRLNELKQNPQQFIENVTKIMNYQKQMLIVGGIRYKQLGGSEVFAQELFETEELTGYLKNMLTDTTKSLYEAVVYDSGTELAFAKELEAQSAVKLYMKLPGWFHVPTPLGEYRPDWAVILEQEGKDVLFFVVETKSTLFTFELKSKEEQKIACGRKHFEELSVDAANPARYVVAMNYQSLLNEAEYTEGSNG